MKHFAPASGDTMPASSATGPLDYHGIRQREASPDATGLVLFPPLPKLPASQAEQRVNLELGATAARLLVTTLDKTKLSGIFFALHQPHLKALIAASTASGKLTDLERAVEQADAILEDFPTIGDLERSLPVKVARGAVQDLENLVAFSRALAPVHAATPAGAIFDKKVAEAKQDTSTAVGALHVRCSEYETSVKNAREFFPELIRRTRDSLRSPENSMEQIIGDRIWRRVDALEFSADQKLGKLNDGVNKCFSETADLFLRMMRLQEYTGPRGTLRQRH